MTTPTPLPLDANALAARVGELEAANNALRDALEGTLGVLAYYGKRSGEQGVNASPSRRAVIKARDAAESALAAYPAASLAAHDAEVLDGVLGIIDSISINYTEAEWHELGRKLRKQRDALAAQAQEVTK